MGHTEQRVEKPLRRVWLGVWVAVRIREEATEKDKTRHFRGDASTLPRKCLGDGSKGHSKRFTGPIQIHLGKSLWPPILRLIEWDDSPGKRGLSEEAEVRGGNDYEKELVSPDKSGVVKGKVSAKRSFFVARLCRFQSS